MRRHLCHSFGRLRKTPNYLHINARVANPNEG
jgi:hypothetical protein